MCVGISMARKPASGGRLQNPRDEVNRAIQRAERGLAAASGEGFREVLKRVRQAVVDSERLVVVLDRVARQGLRPRGSSAQLPPSDVQESIQPDRGPVGADCRCRARGDRQPGVRRKRCALHRRRPVIRRVLGRGAGGIRHDEQLRWDVFTPVATDSDTPLIPHPHLLTATVRGRRPLCPITCAAAGPDPRGGGRRVCNGDSGLR